MTNIHAQNQTSLSKWILASSAYQQLIQSRSKPLQSSSFKLTLVEYSCLLQLVVVDSSENDFIQVYSGCQLINKSNQYCLVHLSSIWMNWNRMDQNGFTPVHSGSFPLHLHLVGWGSYAGHRVFHDNGHATRSTPPIHRGNDSGVSLLDWKSPSWQLLHRWCCKVSYQGQSGIMNS